MRKIRNSIKWLIPLLICIPVNMGAQNLTDDQGNKSGPWKVFYPGTETLRYEAVFEKGSPVGEMKRYNENGLLVALMNFYPNSSKCYTKFFSANKEITAEGLYDGQKKDSVWIYYGNDGAVRMRESYAEGALSGITENYYHSGSVSHSTEYESGIKNGKWQQFYENGNLMQSASYKNNKLHGTYQAFFPEGQIEISGYFSNNLKHGDWEYYSEEGELKDVLKYIQGEIQNPEDLQENYDEFIKHVEENIGNIPDPDEGGL